MLTYWLSKLLELDSNRDNHDSHWLWKETATQFAKILMVYVVGSVNITQMYRNRSLPDYLSKTKMSSQREYIQTIYICTLTSIHSSKNSFQLQLFAPLPLTFPHIIFIGMIFPSKSHLLNCSLISHVNILFLSIVLWHICIFILLISKFKFHTGFKRGSQYSPKPDTRCVIKTQYLTEYWKSSLF